MEKNESKLYSCLVFKTVFIEMFMCLILLNIKGRNILKFYKEFTKYLY